MEKFLDIEIADRLQRSDGFSRKACVAGFNQPAQIVLWDIIPNKARENRQCQLVVGEFHQLLDLGSREGRDGFRQKQAAITGESHHYRLIE